MGQVKVYLDDGKRTGKRKLVEAQLIEDRPTTFLVKLPDGNTVTRKKSRDLPTKENDR